MGESAAESFEISHQGLQVAAGGAETRGTGGHVRGVPAGGHAANGYPERVRRIMAQFRLAPAQVSL